VQVLGKSQADPAIYAYVLDQMAGRIVKKCAQRLRLWRPLTARARARRSDNVFKNRESAFHVAYLAYTIMKAVRSGCRAVLRLRCAAP
jgi:hypothetical protein